jgi:curli biogenesis system outer membrane secretion channel CsgG
MKTKTFLFFSLFQIIFTLGVARGQTADPNAPTMVVAKTESQGVGSWQPAMGDGLAQMLITELNNLPNFKILESVALEDLRSERELGDSGEVSDSESVKKGQWKGADYTFKSTVTRFGSKNSNYGGGGWLPHVPGMPGGGWGSASVSISENEVQIDWRIIDNATREIVASGRADGVEKGTGFNFSSWNGGGFSNNREFMDSALGKATMKALAQIVDKVKTLNIGPGARTINNENAAAAKATELRSVKGTVQLVDGKEIWISLGADHGFAKGDKVKIYKAIPKKNKEGVVVTTDYEPVGEITLERVQKDKSMGEYTGSAQITEDMAAADAAIDIDQLQ